MNSSQAERLRHDEEKADDNRSRQIREEQNENSAPQNLGGDDLELLRYFEILHTDIVSGPSGHGHAPLLTVPAWSSIQVHSWAVENAFDDSSSLTNSGVTDASADNDFSGNIDLTSSIGPGLNSIADEGSIYLCTEDIDLILLARNWVGDGTTGKLRLWLSIVPAE